MHTSTSPQYAIIARCDVAAAMMEPPGGTALVEEVDQGSARLPPRDAQGRRGIRQGLVVQGLGPREARRRRHRRARSDWMLKPTSSWHGFGNLAAGFNMLDPIKATVSRRASTSTGDFAETGIPAAIVTQVPGRARRHCREDGPVLVLHHVHHRHHQGPLEHAADRAAAVQGRLRQEPAAVAHRCRSSCSAHPRYERIGLRDLCQAIHGIYKVNDMARLTTECTCRTWNRR